MCALSPFPHVIIADDDDSVRSLVARVVGRTYRSVQLSLVNDGADALQVFDQRGADLVITNNQMLTMHGMDLIHALRTRSATVPILMLSADRTIAGPALAAGATQFLLKPFRVPELRQTLLGLLPA
ncbi:MAG: hypothetical protein OHK0015_55590 [Chloroflexi bacterium OHK40]